MKRMLYSALAATSLVAHAAAPLVDGKIRIEVLNAHQSAVGQKYVSSEHQAWTKIWDESSFLLARNSYAVQEEVLDSLRKVRFSGKLTDPEIYKFAQPALNATNFTEFSMAESLLAHEQIKLEIPMIYTLVNQRDLIANVTNQTLENMVRTNYQGLSTNPDYHELIESNSKIKPSKKIAGSLAYITSVMSALAHNQAQTTNTLDRITMKLVTGIFFNDKFPKGDERCWIKQYVGKSDKSFLVDTLNNAEPGFYVPFVEETIFLDAKQGLLAGPSKIICYPTSVQDKINTRINVMDKLKDAFEK